MTIPVTDAGIYVSRKSSKDICNQMKYIEQLLGRFQGISSYVFSVILFYSNRL